MVMRKAHHASTRRWAATAAAALLSAMVVTACGGGGDEPPDAVTFAFRMHGRDASQEFRFTTSSAAFITKARQQLSLPVGERKLFPSGPIAAGNGGVNLHWGWHFSGLDLAEAAIELCDGNPLLVQADLPYWLNTVKAFCPWGGYVHAEVAAPVI
jgi:hypothetical protein